jgi:hypothetical protein
VAKLGGEVGEGGLVYYFMDGYMRRDVHRTSKRVFRSIINQIKRLFVIPIIKNKCLQKIIIYNCNKTKQKENEL